ncbi:hypothetical protein LguiA_031943 [Lonicera macranthoides]
MMGWMLVFAILVLWAPKRQLVEGSRIKVNKLRFGSTWKGMKSNDGVNAGVCYFGVPTNQAVEGFQMVILLPPGCDQNVCESFCQDNSCESGRCIFSRHDLTMPLKQSLKSKKLSQIEDNNELRLSLIQRSIPPL